MASADSQPPDLTLMSVVWDGCTGGMTPSNLGSPGLDNCPDGPDLWGDIGLGLLVGNVGFDYCYL